jgi:hypothetical protein
MGKVKGGDCVGREVRDPLREALMDYLSSAGLDRRHSVKRRQGRHELRRRSTEIVIGHFKRLERFTGPP